MTIPFGSLTPSDPSSTDKKNILSNFANSIYPLETVDGNAFIEHCTISVRVEAVDRERARRQSQIRRQSRASIAFAMVILKAKKGRKRERKPVKNVCKTLWFI